MIEFNSLDELVKFLEEKLPSKIKDELFYTKSNSTAYKHRTNDAFIFRELRQMNFAIGVTTNPDTLMFPERYILKWTLLEQFIKTNDSLGQGLTNYQLITINEACEFLSVTRPTLYKLIKENKIPTVQVLSQKRIQIKDLIEYIDSNKNYKKT